MKQKPLVSKTSAATTTVASLLAANHASGIIQYFGPTNELMAGFGSSANITWDIDDSGSHEALIAVYGGGVSMSIRQNANSFSLLANSSLSNLATGYLVSSGRSFSAAVPAISSSTFYYAVGWTSEEAGYFGFRFNDGDGIVYGWAKATFTVGGPNGITITEWAYQDDGSSIAVGVISEPATFASGLGALALGAAGLRRWRKQKKTA